MAPELAVVIPALNEAAALPRLLAQLAAQQDVALEIIVSDGGSTDDTAALAERHGATLVRATRGRGAQMNAGARHAHVPLLLFLHADSGLTDARQMRRAVDALRAAGDDAAGHFPLRFQRGQPGHELFYRYLEGKTRLARPCTINGDQGLMLATEWFWKLGGYDESLPFLEDQRLAAKVFERGRWVTFADALTTSARRFEREGEHRRYALMALIMGLHAAGAREWFALAPQVYAQQRDTARLDLGKYLALTWRVLIEAGPARAAQILWRAGQFVTQNTWQPFYWLDTVLRLERTPCLRFHDAVFAPIYRNPVGDAISTVLMCAWYLVLLPVACAVLP